MTMIAALGLETARAIALCGGGGKTSLMFVLAEAFAANGDTVLVTTTTRMAREEVERGLPLLVGEDLDALCSGQPAAGITIGCRRIDTACGKAIGFEPDPVDRVARSGRFARILVEADGSARRPLKAPLSHEPVFPPACDAVVMVLGLSGLGQPLDDATVFRAHVWAQLTGLPKGRAVTAESVAAMAVHPEGLGRGAPPGARRTLYLNQCDDPGRLSSAHRIMDDLARRSGGGLGGVVAGRLLPEPRVEAVLRFH